MEAAARKEGEVLYVKIDKKKAHATWIEFKDKTSARRAARRGLHIDDVCCRVVRLRPIAAVPEGRDRADRAGGLAQGRRAGSSRTLVVKGLAVAGVALGLEHRLRQLFGECGNVTSVRVSAAREMAFVDFATVTGMLRARKRAWTVGGAPVRVTACRRSLEPADAPPTAANRGPPLAGCRTILVKNLPYTVRRDDAGLGPRTRAAATSGGGAQLRGARQ